MTDATEQIQYLHTPSQISRSTIDELTKENKKLKEENGNQKQILEILHNLKKENERLKRVIDIMDGVIRRKWGLD